MWLSSYHRPSRQTKAHRGWHRALSAWLLISLSHAVSSTLTQLASGNGNYDTTGKCPGGAVYAVAYSPDGKQIASGSNDNSGYGATVKLWDLATGATLWQASEPAWVQTVAYSPNGTQLASGYSFPFANNTNNATIKLWDAATGAVVETMNPASAVLKNHAVEAVAYSPDGRQLASGDGTGRIMLWDLATGAATQTLEYPNSTCCGIAIDAVTYSPDGKQLASGDGDGIIKLWDLATGAAVQTLEGSSINFGDAVNAVAYSPDGTQLASGKSGGIIRLWDLATGAEVQKLQGSSINFGVHAVAYSPDGKQLASGYGTGNIKLWDPATGVAVQTLQCPTGCGAVNTVAYSPDGKQLASGYDNGTIKLWDPASGAVMQRLECPSSQEAGSGSASSVSPSQTTTAASTDINSILSYIQTGIPTSVQSESSLACFVNSNFSYYPTPSWWSTLPHPVQSYYSSINQGQTGACTSPPPAATNQEQGGGLSAGGKAGIGVGVTAGVLSIIGVIIWLWKAGFLASWLGIAGSAGAASQPPPSWQGHAGEQEWGGQASTRAELGAGHGHEELEGSIPRKPVGAPPGTTSSASGNASRLESGSNTIYEAGGQEVRETT